MKLLDGRRYCGILLLSRPSREVSLYTRLHLSKIQERVAAVSSIHLDDSSMMLWQQVPKLAQHIYQNVQAVIDDVKVVLQTR